MPDRYHHDHPASLERVLGVLSRLCPLDRRESVEGDLIEAYSEYRDRYGALAANLLVWLEVLQFLRPSARRQVPDQSSPKGFFMMSNYLTIALRTLKKHVGHTAINVAGLSAGLACFILVGLFVRFELSFDRFHRDGDRVYRILRVYSGDDMMGARFSPVLSAPIGDVVRAEVPGVESMTLRMPASGVLATGDDVFNQNGLYTDSAFLDIFDFPILSRSGRTILDDPGGIVLTESTAHKLFGDTDPIGRFVTWRQLVGEEELTVEGVVADPPPNSSITFDFLLPLASNAWYERNRNAWSNRSLIGHVLVRKDADRESVEDQLGAVAGTYMGDDSFYGSNPDQIPGFRLQSFQREHLWSTVDFGIPSEGDISTLYLFSAIALIILLIACVNYTNLATARSATRAQEIGIRKVAGAYRSNLVLQFLGESILTVFAATLLGVGLARLLLPGFNDLIQRDIGFGILAGPVPAAGLLGLCLVVGVLAGLHPAIVLSRFDPVRAFRFNLGASGSGARLRNLLVVGQFTATIILIASTVVIRGQISFMQNRDSGLERDQVLTVTLNELESWKSFDRLSSQLTAHPGVADVSSSYHLPTRIGTRSSVRSWEGKQDDQQLVVFNTGVSDNFIDFFGLDLVKGRGFSPDGTDIGRGLIINESARTALGWSTAVGKSLEFSDNGTEVIGVVRDYNFLPLDRPIEPLILYQSGKLARHVHIRVATDEINETVAFVSDIVRAIEPGYPVAYRFLDDDFNEMYAAHARLGHLIGAITMLALIIASLGLFALATFAVSRRRLEIGIRKVSGARTSDIFFRLSREFTLLVLAAFLIASPIVYVIMDRWLEDFAFRIDLSPWIFVGVGVATLCAAWLTIAFQSWRAARLRPVSLLRSE